VTHLQAMNGVLGDVLEEGWELLCCMMQTMSPWRDTAGTEMQWRRSDRRDYRVCAGFAIAIFALNWGFRIFVVSPLWKRSCGMTGVRLQKCSQSACEATLYLSFSILGFCVVGSQPWVWPSEQWWIGYTAGAHELIRRDLQCYYLLYLARYVQQFISVLLEPVRKDFYPMLMHHACSALLIYLSYEYAWTRIGAVTMLVLDPADCALHVAKVCVYIGEQTQQRRWESRADVFFVLFVISFFVTHIVLLGYVCWSAAFEGPLYIPSYGGLPGQVCIATLYLIYTLQFYWMFLIARAAMRLVSGEELQDDRSDDEGDEVPQAGPRSRVWVSVSVVCLLVAALRADRLKCACQALSVVAFNLSTEVGAFAQREVDAGILIFLVVSFVTWRFQLSEPMMLRRASDERSHGATLACSSLAFGLYLVVAQTWLPLSAWQADGCASMPAVFRCYYLLHVVRTMQHLASSRQNIWSIAHLTLSAGATGISYAYGFSHVGVVAMVLRDSDAVAAAGKSLFSDSPEQRFATPLVVRLIHKRLVPTLVVVRVFFCVFLWWTACLEPPSAHGVMEWNCIKFLVLQTSCSLPVECWKLWNDMVVQQGSEEH